MNKPHKAERWHELADLLKGLQEELQLALAEAQQRFAAAPHRPLAAWEIEALVTAAMGRRVEQRQLSHGAVDPDLFCQADVVAQVQASGTCGEWLSSMVGLHPRVSLDALMTDVDSASVDTRILPDMRTPLESRLVRPGVDPVVWNVGVGCDELAVGLFRRLRDGTLRWDARLDAAGWEMFESSVFGPAGLDDSGREDAWRNKLRQN